MREGPSPKAQVSSSLAHPCPCQGLRALPRCGDAPSWPDPTVGPPPLGIPSADSPLAAVRFGGAAELVAAIAPVPGVGRDVDLRCGLVPLLPLPPPLFPEGRRGCKICGNNTCCCFDKGVALAGGASTFGWARYPFKYCSNCEGVHAGRFLM